MDNNIYIKELLKRYFDGESSLEEERKLKTYFQQSEVDPDLHKYKALFDVIRQEQKRTMTPRTFRIATKNKRRYVMAGSIALLLSLGVFVAHEYGTSKKQTEWAQTDTYDDPEMAKAEIKAALALVSRKLNKGTGSTRKGLKKVKVINSIFRRKN